MDQVVFHSETFQRIINGRYGGVAKWLERRAQAIEDAAKLNASVSDGVAGTPRSFAPGLRVDTGRGRDSITHELGVDSKGIYARIGTNVDYMAIQELQQRYTWLVPALRSANS